jgi:hypothetical protein
MPAVALLISVVGITLVNGVYMFAARLLTPAVPFLVLLVAWALSALLRRSPVAFAVAAAVLVLAYWSTSTSFVYEKSLEVSGEYDPHEYRDILAQGSDPEDLVFFSHMSLAGWYEMDRDERDPPWAYALRWLPIVRPMSEIEPVVQRAAEEYPRLWFVLYQGSFGPGRDLKDWLDETFFPERMIWGTKSLFLSYTPPTDGLRRISPNVDFEGLIRLEVAEYPVRAGPAGQVPVVLHWRALGDSLPDLRVVVQAWDDTGTVLAQRDVRPANWERPAYTWRQGERIEDRHGLILSGGTGVSAHLAISVYDSGTGEMKLVDGSPFFELGTVERRSLE